MTWVKICGIRSYEEALWAMEAGADALGFVFVPTSKRYIPPQEAAQITHSLPPAVKTVGVFLNEKPEQVAKIARECSLDMIQLHGQEKVEDYTPVSLPIIKALSLDLVSTTQSSKESSIQSNLQINKLSPISSKDSTSPDPFAYARKLLAHYQGYPTHRPWGILLDAAFGKAVGGTGRALPWPEAEFQKFIQEIKSISIPLILAGGLSPANIQTAIHLTQPFGVDVSSGVEEQGRKSKRRITEFLAKAKGHFI